MTTTKSRKEPAASSIERPAAEIAGIKASPLGRLNGKALMLNYDPGEF